MSRNRDLAASFARAAVGRPGPTPPIIVYGADSAEDRKIKYTLLLDPQDADDLDALLRTIRRATGTRPLKSDIIRSLIRRAAGDPTWQHAIADVLR